MTRRVLRNQGDVRWLNREEIFGWFAPFDPFRANREERNH